MKSRWMRLIGFGLAAAAAFAACAFRKRSRPTRPSSSRPTPAPGALGLFDERLVGQPEGGQGLAVHRGRRAPSVAVDGPASSSTRPILLGQISAYEIDPLTGELTAVPGQPFMRGSDPTPSRSSRREVRLRGQRRRRRRLARPDRSRPGALPRTDRSRPPRGPTRRSRRPDGEFLYVANAYPARLRLSMNSASAALDGRARSPFATGGYVRSVAVDPAASSLTPPTTRRGTSGLRHRRRDGSADGCPGLPVPRGTDRPVRRGPSDGRVRLRRNRGSGDVSAYTINATTGALTTVMGSSFEGAYAPTRSRSSLGEVRPGGQLLVRRRLGLPHQRGFGSAVGAVRLAVPDGGRGAPSAIAVVRIAQ